MVASGHTAAGVIIGITAYHFLGQGDLISNLVLSGSAGVVSHYILDFIPHGHFISPKQFKSRIGQIIIFDVLLPVILFLGGIYLISGFSERLFFVLFAVGGALLPDVLDGLIYTKVIKPNRILQIENNFHQILHWHGTGSNTLLLGIRDIWQALMVLTALFFIIWV